MLPGTMPLTPAAANPWVKWGKVLIKAAEWAWPVVWGELESEHVASDPQDVQWCYAVMRFQRPTPTGTIEDYAQIGFNIVNITGGDIDTTWTAGDYTNLTTAFDEWWGVVRTHVDDGLTLLDYRYYQRSFADPLQPTKRFADMGAPRSIATKNLAGQFGGTPLPHQVAMTITLKTAAPRHWGRVYLPGLSSGKIDGVYGRWTAGIPAAISNQTAELVDDLGGQGYVMVVPVTQVNKVLQAGLLSVTSIQVDDIPDVIRRRRPRQPAARVAGVPIA